MRTWKVSAVRVRPLPMPRRMCATPPPLPAYSTAGARRHGEVAGLIHGAGLIKDKLIRQKSVESFDRVLETKLDGALNLIRHGTR